jgi:cytochrome c oxidase subunit 4
MSDLTHVEDIQKQVRIYLSVFAALAVLTVVTVGVGYMDLPILPALIVALTIATIKGSLVAAYFMHLISEKRLIQSLVVLSLGLLVTMFAIFTIYYFDQRGGEVAGL